MKENEYKCAHCGNIYEKGWSDEESFAEATENFGKHPKDWRDGLVIICDDCYQIMNPKNHPKEVELAKKFI